MTREEIRERQQALNQARAVVVHDSGIIGVWSGGHTINFYDSNFSTISCANFGEVPKDYEQAWNYIHKRIDDYLKNPHQYHI